MNDSRVISYRALRKFIGIIGFFLPVWLVLGKIFVFQDTGIQPSISAYYHHDPGVRDWLVGGLFAIGVFLFSYRGYDNPNPARQRLPFRPFRGTDDLISTVAGVCAVGVAIFPTQEGSTSARELVTNIPGLHVLFAAVFFISLAYILFFRFTDHGPATRDPETRHEAKQKRRGEDRIYRGCSGAIIACLVLIVVVWALQDNYPIIERLYPVLLLEWGAIWAFSIAWFLKGSDYLKGALRGSY